MSKTRTLVLFLGAKVVFFRETAKYFTKNLAVSWKNATFVSRNAKT
jgi:hypothetical protein